MNIVGALALNTATDRAEVNQFNNGAYSNSTTLKVNEVIPGLPTENWLATTIGSGGGNLRCGSSAAPTGGARNTFEVHATYFVPYNTDTQNITSGGLLRDVLLFTGFQSAVKFSMRYQADGSLTLTAGAAANTSTLNFPGFVAGHVYHICLRVEGQTNAATADANVELWINDQLVVNKTNISLGVNSGGLLVATSNSTLALSGPATEALYRDIVVFDGLTSALGVAPPYYRVEDLVPAVITAANTFNLGSVNQLTDSDDATFAQGLNTGDRLNLELDAPGATGTTVGQRIYMRATKATVENNNVDIEVSNGAGTVFQQEQYTDLTTNTFTDRFFSFAVNADINDLVIDIENNDP